MVLQPYSTKPKHPKYFVVSSHKVSWIGETKCGNCRERR